jgi:hypothetical protein
LKRALPLFLLSVVFVAGFLWQRSRSLAERLLTDRAALLAAGAALGVADELVLGLCYEREIHREPPAAWPERTRAALTEFRALRARLGALELALLAYAGQESVVRDALARHAGDPVRAAAWVRAQPQGIAVHRILGVGRRLLHTPRA